MSSLWGVGPAETVSNNHHTSSYVTALSRSFCIFPMGESDVPEAVDGVDGAVATAPIATPQASPASRKTAAMESWSSVLSAASAARSAAERARAARSAVQHEISSVKAIKEEQLLREDQARLRPSLPSSHGVAASPAFQPAASPPMQLVQPPPPPVLLESMEALPGFVRERSPPIFAKSPGALPASYPFSPSYAPSFVPPQPPPPPPPSVPPREEGESHWKWAFKALEERNRELVTENQSLQAKLDALMAAMAANSGAPIAAACGRSAAMEGNRYDADPRHYDEHGGYDRLGRPMIRSASEGQHAIPGRAPRSLVYRDATSSRRTAEPPEQGGGHTYSLPALPNARLPPRASAAPPRGALSERPPFGGGGGGGGVGYAARGGGYSAKRGPSLTLARGGSRSPTRSGVAGPSPTSVVPSKRELARAYAKKVPRPPVRWTDQTGGSGGGVAGVASPGEDGSSMLIDEATVAWADFKELASELEPDREWADGDLRKRFDELHPEKGKVFTQDYRITLLFETLSKKAPKVIDLFRQWDSDNSATVDKDEFTNALRSLGFDYSTADIDLVFTHLDGDGSGLVDYIELNAKLRPQTCRSQAIKLRTSVQLKRGGARKINTNSKRKLKSGMGAASAADQIQAILRENFLKVFDVFKMWDEDNSGHIDRNEFQQCMGALGLDAPRAEIDELFDFFDTDASGSISYDEVYKKLRAGKKNAPQKKKGARNRPPPPPPPGADEAPAADAPQQSAQEPHEVQPEAVREEVPQQLAGPASSAEVAPYEAVEPPSEPPSDRLSQPTGDEPPATPSPNAPAPEPEEPASTPISQEDFAVDAVPRVRRWRGAQGAVRVAQALQGGGSQNDQVENDDQPS